MRPGEKIICTLALGLGIGQAESTPSLTVRIGNYARVPKGTLAEAQQMLAKIFRAAGIDLVISDRTSSDREPAGGGTCEHSKRCLNLNLSIVDATMAAQVPCPRHIMGFALASGAFVCFHHVRDAAGKPDLVSVVLGHVMAHELGHLLLGKGHSSSTGLMSRRLYDANLKRACQGGLLFDHIEAQRIRAQLLEGTQVIR